MKGGYKGGGKKKEFTGKVSNNLKLLRIFLEVLSLATIFSRCSFYIFISTTYFSPYRLSSGRTYNYLNIGNYCAYNRSFVLGVFKIRIIIFLLYVLVNLPVRILYKFICYI
jgi:hypothetical protein